MKRFVKTRIRNGRRGEVLIQHQTTILKLCLTTEKDTSKLFIGKNQIQILFLSVCDSPSHIEARERDTKISWISSKSILVHDSASTTANFPNTINSNPRWAHGISKDFG